MRYRVDPNHEPLGGAHDWDGLRLRGLKVVYRDFIFGGNDTPAPPQPDPAIGQAAQVSADVAREQLAYNKQRDAEMKPLFDRIVNSQAGSMDDNRARASEQWARYKDKGIPAEDTYFSESANYGNEADQATQAGRAMQDVGHSYDAADAANKRDMMRYGVNPASGRFTGSQRTLDLGRAAATSAAGTTATNNTRLLGMSMRENAAKFARGLPTTGIAADSLALSGGNAAGSTMGKSADITNAGTNLALNANQQGANILSGQFSQQNTAYNNALQANRDTMSGIGSMVGMGAALYTGNPLFMGLGGKRAGGEIKRRPRMLSYAGGGEVSGPGTGTSDSVPAVVDGQDPLAVSDGEYVVKADTTQNVYGTDTMDDVNAGKAEIIPSKVLIEIGRREVRAMTLAMAGGGGKRAPVTLDQGA